MSELDQLIETAYRLSNRLSTMADDEIKYGYDLGYKLENMSYDVYVIANDLKEVKSCLVGGVA